jgi:hypothetical protein
MVVAIVALFLALGGSGYAALSGKDKKAVKRIAANQITASAPGLSVKHAGSADSATNAGHAGSADSATNAGHASTADSAAAVGGVSIQPVSVAVPDPTPTNVKLLDVNGSTVTIGCIGSVQFELARLASSPPITGQWIRDGLNPLVIHEPPLGGTGAGGTALGFTATVREGSGRVTRITVDAFYETNAFGGSEDCFVQGTIERFG